MMRSIGGAIQDTSGLVLHFQYFCFLNLSIHLERFFYNFDLICERRKQCLKEEVFWNQWT